MRGSPACGYRKSPTVKPLVVRFWAKVDKSGECWLWTGAKNEWGYGRAVVTRDDVRTAHRLSWEMANGLSVPAGLCVCHRCDTPACVRPEHLFVGTVADNNADMVAKRRHRMPEQRGEKNHQAKLTSQQAAEIRRRRESGDGGSVLAREFGISPQAVCAIFKGRAWAHAAS